MNTKRIITKLVKIVTGIGLLDQPTQTVIAVAAVLGYPLRGYGLRFQYPRMRCVLMAEQLCIAAGNDRGMEIIFCNLLGIGGRVILF